MGQGEQWRKRVDKREAEEQKEGEVEHEKKQ